MPATDDDTLLPFSLPNLCKKKVTAAFDGGQVSSDGGVFLLAAADKRLGLIDTLAGLIPDARDPAQITHRWRISCASAFSPSHVATPMATISTICAMTRPSRWRAGGCRTVVSTLASQPTISRLENAPNRRDLIRMSRGMVDFWCHSHPHPPKGIVLDIDDTADTVHGHQQMSLFNAHYDERCFLPIHVYDAESGHCVVTILREGKTPNGKEVRAHIRRLVRRIRTHWPNTIITIRGDGHYGRQEAMDWCDDNGVKYIFGLGPNKTLAKQIFAKLHKVCIRRAVGQLDKVRGFATTRYAAKSWSRPRRVLARIEATKKGADVRYIVTNLTKGTAQRLYESIYCARGQAENLIKRHKSQLASDRTSCRSPLANQMRLILHTAAFWLVRIIRDAILKHEPLASGEFSTIRLRLLKVAVRVRETTTRIKLAFAANCPNAELFRDLIRSLIPRPT